MLRGLAALGLPGELLAIHALTIGAIGGMTIGMMTRTARGHTGRPLVADRFEVTCYVLVALAAAIRVFGGLLLPGAYVASVNGADGIAFDANGRLRFAANQADEIVALNDDGRIVARFGEFQGINCDGTPNGLHFPASLAIVGKHMFVTNLALPLAGAPGDEQEDDVTLHTVPRIRRPNR